MMNMDMMIPESIKKTRQYSRMEIETKILAAAETVFAESGFDGASTAEIAKRAGLPKANLHYYFKTKADLYQRVMEDINRLWMSLADKFTPDSDPALAIADYIRHKINLARTRPLASKVYASEILRGAPHLKEYLAHQCRNWLNEKAKVIQYWVDQGKIRPIDPHHFFFLLWSSTQTYADFQSQMELTLGHPLNMDDYKKASDQLADIILNGLVKPKIH